MRFAKMLKREILQVRDAPLEITEQPITQLEVARRSVRAQKDTDRTELGRDCAGYTNDETMGKAMGLHVWRWEMRSRVLEDEEESAVFR